MRVARRGHAHELILPLKIFENFKRVLTRRSDSDRRFQESFG